MKLKLTLFVAQLDMEGVDYDEDAPEGAEVLEASDLDADEEPKDTYVKKDLKPRPYHSEFGDSTE